MVKSADYAVWTNGTKGGVNMQDASDDATLVHALNLLAQSWGCAIAEVQTRVERAAVDTLIAAGGSLDGTDHAQRQLAEFLLRRDLNGFGHRVRQICRRSTIEPSTFPNVAEFERWGFQDDGPLRSHQVAILAARTAAGEASQAGVLAAVAYAEAMCDFCSRKQTLLKNRTSAELMGFRLVKKSTEESMAEWQSPQPNAVSFRSDTLVHAAFLEVFLNLQRPYCDRHFR